MLDDVAPLENARSVTLELDQLKTDVEDKHVVACRMHPGFYNGPCIRPESSPFELLWELD